MSTEQNKKIILRLFSEGIMERKFHVFDELIADDFINHGILNAKTGPAGYGDYVHELLNAFPDLKVNIQQIIADGDTVATRGFIYGTHDGNYMGQLPTGKKIRFNYFDFWKIRNNKCAECWLQMDLAGVMDQLRPLQVAL